MLPFTHIQLLFGQHTSAQLQFLGYMKWIMQQTSERTVLYLVFIKVHVPSNPFKNIFLQPICTLLWAHYSGFDCSSPLWREINWAVGHSCNMKASLWLFILTGFSWHERSKAYNYQGLHLAAACFCWDWFHKSEFLKIFLKAYIWRMFPSISICYVKPQYLLVLAFF